MVSGKLDALDQYQIRTKFQEFGNVVDLVVEDACAFLTLVDNEVVQQLLNMKEIMIFGTKLNISQVLEGPMQTPDFGVLFQNGDLPLHNLYPASQDNVEGSCQTYQPVIPYPYQQTMW